MGFALDEIDVCDLRRCETCGWKLIRTDTQAELKKHLGHRLRGPRDYSILEYLKIKLGVL